MVNYLDAERTNKFAARYFVSVPLFIYFGWEMDISAYFFGTASTFPYNEVNQ
jgi:hypothetical protein